MSTKLSSHIQTKLDRLLLNVGDMALKRRAKRIVTELEFKKGDTVLDLGCGNGYYLSLLKRLDLSLKLTGVDNDVQALSDAKKYLKDNNIKLVLADIRKLHFQNKLFDKIIISEVIEHVDNDKEVLEEAYRVLKAGGILTLTTCNIDYPFFWDPVNWILQHLFKTHIKRGFWAGIWNQHLKMYKRKKIENLIRNAGFNLEISESLTRWCLPFNHYLINFVARLFYSDRLPHSISGALNKFKNNRQPFLIKMAYNLLNLFDKLNDLWPQKNGVSIFIKAKK